MANESVCSKMKMAAKRPLAVQKEVTSFFGFSQSGSKKAKDIFKILLCLDIEIIIVFFNSLCHVFDLMRVKHMVTEARISAHAH